MGWLFKFIMSSVGAKVVMGISGIAMVVWLIAHLAGNLQIFIGQDQMNAYAAMMKGNAALLWTMRIGMLGIILVHILAGIRLAALNRAARPQRYHGRRYQEAKPWARAMAFSGVLLGVFVVFHLMHFTVGNVHPDYFVLRDSQGRHDVYNMFVLSFTDPLTAAAYIVAMLLLAAHIVHGTPSFFQSLGLNTPRWFPITRKAGNAVALLIVIGNIAMPAAVLGGLLKPTADAGNAVPTAAREAPTQAAPAAAAVAPIPRQPLPVRPGVVPNRPGVVPERAPGPRALPQPRALNERQAAQERPQDLRRLFPRPVRPQVPNPNAPNPGEAR